jgi:murein DD-endopeptidase MepM/ murein hydrolase activator NlpD
VKRVAVGLRAFGLVLALLVAGAGTLSAADLLAVSRVIRGEPLGVVLRTDEAFLESSSWEIRLLDAEGGIVARAEGFPTITEERRTVGVAILGIPSTLRPGEYRLETEIDARLVSRKVSVEPKEFRREEIPLNAAMTELRATPDPAKIEEARQLLSLLAEFDLEAFFHATQFVMPVTGARRTSEFGDRRLFRYVDGTSAQAIHNGLDLAAPVGTPILAAGGGRVVFAAPRIVTGNSVVIEHLPGVYSLYYHLDEIDVQEGELVEQGGRIGTLGNTGLSTGPHLHWEVRVAGIPVDPEAFVRRPILDTEEISAIIADDSVLRPGIRP